MCGGSPSERETETDNGRMEKLGAGADVNAADGIVSLRNSSTPSAAVTALVTCDTRDNNKKIVILAKLVNIANV